MICWPQSASQDGYKKTKSVFRSDRLPILKLPLKSVLAHCLILYFYIWWCEFTGKKEVESWIYSLKKHYHKTLTQQPENFNFECKLNMYGYWDSFTSQQISLKTLSK